MIILREFYERDVLTMPGDVPAFHSEAAVWAARYVFYVSQLILLRDVDEDVMQGYLSPFEGMHSAEAIYSADLLLRFLPDLFRLGSGLSPGDPLVAGAGEGARLGAEQRIATRAGAAAFCGRHQRRLPFRSSLTCPR